LLVAHYEKQPYFQAPNRERVRALLLNLAQSTPARRLLDVGCGTGLILDLAHDLFQKLDGIDITPEMIERVTPRENVRTQLASAESIPFPNETFDLVTAYGVLHHIDNLGRVFREVRRVLKGGGVFYADESPSQHYSDTLFALSPHLPMTDIARQARDRVMSDAAEYQKRFGLPVEVVQRAMVQNYAFHALRQDKLEHLLKSAGFEKVQITFRRFLGEEQCQQAGGEELVNTVQNFLVSLLPVTRGLFKYFVLVAR